MCILIRKLLTTGFTNYWWSIIAISLILNQVNSSDPIVTNKDLLSSKKNHYDNNYLPTKLNKYKRPLRYHNEFCLNPYNPPHTKYKIWKESEISYTPGNVVLSGSILEVSCEKRYNLSPLANKYSICINGKWESSPTICSRTCPSLSSTASTTVKCIYEGIPLANCFNPINNTRVILSCTQFYEEASIGRNPIRVCRNGKWNPPIPQCYPICGMKTPKGIPDIINGTNAPVGDYPWQVGVYNTRKELICSGSIIDENIILSAAHCFTDHRGNVYPTENYYIAAGKYYREYHDDRDELAQYSNVLYIHVPENYKGGVHFYGSDIAIIVLTDLFTLSEVVQPICVVLNDEIQDMHLRLNDNGLVTGWGQTEEGRRLSEELKELVVPYIPYQKCFDEVSENFRRYITPDKICGGYTNSGTSICQGDSGGALVFKNVDDNRYYIKGIVSTSPSTRERVCDSNSYSLYTAVSYHTHFVRDLVQFYQRQQLVEFTSQSNDTDQEIENNNGCRFPSFPPNGKYVYLHQDNNQTSPGDYVPIRSALILSCDLGYEDISSHTARSYCLHNGQWMPTLTTCKKTEVSDDCFVPGEDGIGKCTEMDDCIAFSGVLKDLFTENGNFPLFFEMINKYQCRFIRNFPKLCCYATNKSVEILLKNLQEFTYSPHNVSNHKNIDLLPKECGVASSDNRTSNWDKADLFEFPWMVVFIYQHPYVPRDEKLQCAGTIINNRYILSSASCCGSHISFDYPYNMIGAAVGIYSYKSEPSCVIKDENITVCADPYQEIEMENIVFHDINDIALVRLSRPLQFTNTLQPICLPIFDEYKIQNMTNVRLTIPGWTEYTVFNDSENSDLRKVEVIGHSKIDECKNLYGIWNLELDIQQCCNVYNNTLDEIEIETKFLCVSDLQRNNIKRMAPGGPLQGIKSVNGEYRHVQFGIDLNTYGLGIAVRVDYFMNWILDNIKV